MSVVTHGLVKVVLSAAYIRRTVTKFNGSLPATLTANASSLSCLDGAIYLRSPVRTSTVRMEYYELKNVMLLTWTFLHFQIRAACGPGDAQILVN